MERILRFHERLTVVETVRYHGIPLHLRMKSGNACYLQELLRLIS